MDINSIVAKALATLPKELAQTDKREVAKQFRAQLVGKADRQSTSAHLDTSGNTHVPTKSRVVTAQALIGAELLAASGMRYDAESVTNAIKLVKPALHALVAPKVKVAPKA